MSFSIFFNCLILRVVWWEPIEEECLMLCGSLFQITQTTYSIFSTGSSFAWCVLCMKFPPTITSPALFFCTECDVISTPRDFTEYASSIKFTVKGRLTSHFRLRSGSKHITCQSSVTITMIWKRMENKRSERRKTNNRSRTLFGIIM